MSSTDLKDNNITDEETKPLLAVAYRRLPCDLDGATFSMLPSSWQGILAAFWRHVASLVTASEVRDRVRAATAVSWLRANGVEHGRHTSPYTGSRLSTVTADPFH